MGNSLGVGTQYNISWITEDLFYIDENDIPQPDTIKIELSRNNGSTWETIISSTANNGSYKWNVTGPATDKALIRVSAVNLSNVLDVSDPFSIGNVVSLNNVGQKCISPYGVVYTVENVWILDPNTNLPVGFYNNYNF
jgi:hypothetical protein